MVPEIKFTICQNDEVVKTITNEVNEQCFVKSLVEFQSTVNAVLTKFIEESGGSAGDCNMDEENDDSDEGQEDDQVSPMKKKK